VRMNLVYITDAYDGSRIMAHEVDVKEACKRCDAWDSCHGADIEDGCGCLIAYIKLCHMRVKFIYEAKK